MANTSAWNLSNDIVFTSCINWSIFPPASSRSLNKFFRHSCISFITAGACSKASSPNVHTLGDNYSRELVCGFIKSATGVPTSGLCEIVHSTTCLHKVSHRRFKKSATGVPTSGFCGIVHSTTSLGIFFSFTSFYKQTTRGSHLLSG